MDRLLCWGGRDQAMNLVDPKFQHTIMMTSTSSQAGEKKQVMTLSTRSAGAPDSLAYWHELVSDKILPLDFRLLGAAPFEAEMKCFDVADLHISHIRASPHCALRTSELSQHAGSESLIFNFVLGGSCEARQDGRQTLLKDRGGAFCNAARPYALNFHEPVQILVLQLPYDALGKAVRGLDCLAAQDFSTGSEIFPLVLNYIGHLATRTHQLDGVPASRIRQNLVDLVSAMMTESLQRGPMELSECKTAALVRVRSYIESNISNPELNPSLVSGALHLSVRYINQLLEKEGTSLSRLIWRRRLELVAEDLIDPRVSALSISTIAFNRGFNDLAHFSKSFRQRYAKTPRDYRATRGMGLDHA
ncbi:hypothetical protein Hsc_4554 [Herbaspirillum seropedicae]|nr:hypothetical protein Hsc_4554 [Herbaspirillum seropedicae]